jgi:hypothetical protein
MQVRCLIQRRQQAKPSSPKGPSKLVKLGECWIEQSHDDEVRYDRLRQAVWASNWSMHFYTESEDTGYFYNITVY